MKFAVTVSFNLFFISFLSFATGFLEERDFPTHLVRHLEVLKSRDDEEKRQREVERNTCKVHFTSLFEYQSEINQILTRHCFIVTCSTEASVCCKTQFALQQLLFVFVENVLLNLNAGLPPFDSREHFRVIMYLLGSETKLFR